MTDSACSHFIACVRNVNKDYKYHMLQEGTKMIVQRDDHIKDLVGWLVLLIRPPRAECHHHNAES